MIFDSKEWKFILERYPLTGPELITLRQSITETAMVAHAIVAWGEALRQWQIPVKWVKQLDGGWKAEDSYVIQ